MQNNEEQIFDNFIRDKLENTAPDMTLFESSFNTFLLERKEKKKKRRWFFWLFLFLPFFIIPVGYYIISSQSNFPKSNKTGNEVSTPIDSKDNSNTLNTEIDEQNKSTDSAFVKREGLDILIQFDSSKVVAKRDMYKLQQNNFNSQPDSIEQNNEQNKTTSADSAISSANTSQKIINKKIDSALKKKDTGTTKVDTFYIVW